MAFGLGVAFAKPFPASAWGVHIVGFTGGLRREFGGSLRFMEFVSWVFFLYNCVWVDSVILLAAGW